MNHARWLQLMNQWNAPRSDKVYADLEAAYSEPHRHYHTGHHVKDCLAQLDRAGDIATAPEEVELALWFHDTIYRPGSSRNESRSADWAQRFLRSVDADEAKGNRVCTQILATRHGVDALSGDTAVVVDIDLSILGRTPAEYDVYERAIRAEYRWVPAPIYRRKRIEILESFLQRASIYATEYFRARYESAARGNLRRAIRDLAG